jgi:hypothetical protein
MKKIISFTVISLLLMGFSACKKEISYAQYLLQEGVQWTRLYCNDDHQPQQDLVVINSNQELQKYIMGNTPDIDFSQYTLLLARGCANRGGYGIVKSLQQTSKKHYTLNVQVILDDTDYTGIWEVALVTYKLSEKSKVDLNITTKR